jgi:hypothetical protein
MNDSEPGKSRSPHGGEIPAILKGYPHFLLNKFALDDVGSDYVNLYRLLKILTGTSVPFYLSANGRPESVSDPWFLLRGHPLGSTVSGKIDSRATIRKIRSWLKIYR